MMKYTQTSCRPALLHQQTKEEMIKIVSTFWPGDGLDPGSSGVNSRVDLGSVLAEFGRISAALFTGNKLTCEPILTVKTSNTELDAKVEVKATLFIDGDIAAKNHQVVDIEAGGQMPVFTGWSQYLANDEVRQSQAQTVVLAFKVNSDEFDPKRHFKQLEEDCKRVRRLKRSRSSRGSTTASSSSSSSSSNPSSGDCYWKRLMQEEFESQSQSDVTVVFNERRFRVNSFVIGMHSKMFHRMLNCEAGDAFEDCRSRTFDLSGWEARFGATAVDLEELVKFHYCPDFDGGKVGWESNALVLLQLAHYVEFKYLMDLCVDYVTEKMTSELCPQVLILASQMDLKELFDAALEYLVFHFSEVYASEHWNDLEKDPQLMEVIEEETFLDPEVQFAKKFIKKQNM